MTLGSAGLALRLATLKTPGLRNVVRASTMRDMSRRDEARVERAERRRTARYRERMRAAGLRPIQIWVPDTKAASFVRKLRLQVARLRGKPEEREALDFIESIGDAGS